MYRSLISFSLKLSALISLPLFAADCAHILTVKTVQVSDLDLCWSERQSLTAQKNMRTFFSSLVKDKAIDTQTQFEVLWRLARMPYFFVNFWQGTDKELPDDEKIKLLEAGYLAAEKAAKLNPQKVEGHYWYAINLGRYGQIKGIASSFKNAGPGKDALLKAISINPTYHWAGPYRVVARYYEEVPRFISFGDKKLAEEYFKKAIQTSPGFYLNHIYYARFLNNNGRKEEAKKVFADVEKIVKQKPTKDNTDGKFEEEKYLTEYESLKKELNN